MAKQLTILFWGFIYGEVIGYVLSALSGSPFEPLLLSSKWADRNGRWLYRRKLPTRFC